MKAVLIVFALVCLGSAFAAHIKPLSAQEYQFLFKNWMKQHDRDYSGSAEFNTRYNIWRENLDKIRQHQANPHKTHTMTMNKFGDLTATEFKEMYCTLTPISNNFMRSQNAVKLPTTSVPDSVDWVAAKKVTGVKDQGQCGSCWAFSTTGSIEGGYAVDNNCDATVTISEQELVDCSTAQGNQGCGGGLMDQAFEFVIANGGLCSEADYPYTATNNNCTSSGCKSVLSITKYVDVPVNNEDQLQAAVATRPVSVAVDAETWQFYSGGVLTSSCGTSLDHGVLAAGYGTDNGQAYWLVKNSWGGSWGEAGYIRLARGTGSGNPGQCGICMAASYPTGVKAVTSFHRHHKH